MPPDPRPNGKFLLLINLAGEPHLQVDCFWGGSLLWNRRLFMVCLKSKSQNRQISKMSRTPTKTSSVSWFLSTVKNYFAYPQTKAGDYANVILDVSALNFESITF